MNGPVLTGPALPRFEVVRRLRPVSLIEPGSAQPVDEDVQRVPMPAPYAAVVLPLPEAGPGSLAFHLGDHVLTAELDAALSALVDTLKASERFDTADAVQMAQAALGQSIGKLNSRSTRVEQ